MKTVFEILTNPSNRFFNEMRMENNAKMFKSNSIKLLRTFNG